MVSCGCVVGAWRTVVEYKHRIFVMVFNRYPQYNRVDAGCIRPELLGSVYKTSFGDEPFRISLPSIIERALDALPGIDIPRYLAIISPFVVMWDYKWLEAQNTQGAQVEGLREYRELQLIVLISRLLAWGRVQWTNDAVMTMWTSAFLGIISLIVSKSWLSTDKGADMVSWYSKSSTAT